MGKYFGTDGVRGIANLDLTNDLAYDLGRYGAYVLTKHLNGEKARILIGKDTRLSSDMLESAMIAGILSVGCDVVRVGVVPTPAVAFLVKDQRFDAGVVISASHNSYEYNGIKFFNHLGFKLSDEIEEEIESYLIGERTIEDTFTHEKLGHFINRFELVELYLDNAKRALKGNLKGLRVALDCANGATVGLAKLAFEDVDAEVTVISDQPNGININDNCGSTHLDQLKYLVAHDEFDLGLAFDGDGDRVLAVDQHGREFDGDKIMAICAHHLSKNDELSNLTIVATVMSNLGFMNYAKDHGFMIETAPVGDRYVLEKMLEGGYSLGGEQSGHIIFLNRNSTGDGIMTGLILAEAILQSGQNLATWNDQIPRYPQVLVNARVNNNRKNDYQTIDAINRKITLIEESLHGKGRVLIRPSGTEPLVRVMLEGENEVELQQIAQDLAHLFEQYLA